MVKLPLLGAGRASAGDELREELVETRTKLRRARKRARRATRRLRASEERLARVEAELALLQAFSLDVFPGQQVPDDVAAVMAAVRREHLTYLTEDQLASLVGCVLETEASGREGMVIEAGTARGGSAIAMAAAKAPGREMRVYDVFGMIPPPTERDGADVVARYADIEAGKSTGTGGETYYGYREDLLGEVTAAFAGHGVPVAENNVTLVQGLFEDTVHVDGPVALAHVDGDWYESTMTCLERIAPHLVPGGRIVVDDYYTWSGCRDAVDEFLARGTDLRAEMRAKVHLVRPA